MPSATVLYMSMSLDGFIAGPNETDENGLGDGGEGLHDWAMTGVGAGENGVPELTPGGVNGQIVDEFMSTGAVVAGRGTTYVPDVETAMSRAKERRRLFEGLAAEQIELERVRVLQGEGGVTHMRYLVQR
jgi:hypothetical protein